MDRATEGTCHGTALEHGLLQPTAEESIFGFQGDGSIRDCQGLQEGRTVEKDCRG